MADEKKPNLAQFSQKDRETYGLNKRQIKACELRAQCMSQTDAYEATHPNKGRSRKTTVEKASRLFAKNNVKAMLRDMLSSVKIEALMSREEWFLSLQDDLATARELQNMPAIANLQRQAGQATGGLKDSVVVESGGAERDREIIEAAAALDPELASVIKRKMGKHEVFEPLHVVSDNTKAGKPGGKGTG